MLDRNNNALAISILRPSVAINPRTFQPRRNTLKKIARILAIPVKRIKASSQKSGYFAWLKRRVSFSQADRLEKLNIRGLHFVLEPHRYYPLGPNASNLLGFVGTDHKGLLGLEYTLNSTLRPPVAQLKGQRDARGSPVMIKSGQNEDAFSGRDITLTIDSTIQEIAAEALEKWVKKSEAKSGFAIVSDPHNGNLLAVANYPSFDPNDGKSLAIDATRNRAFADLFEPGSVIKPFIVALALENKITTPSSQHNCEESGRYTVDKNLVIHDDHPIATATTEEILTRSSNICIYKLAAQLGAKKVHAGLNRFGFTSKKQPKVTPSQAVGSMQDPEQWSPIRFSNISFGQGLLASGIEIVRAYNAIANGGRVVRTNMFRQLQPDGSESNKLKQQVISPETAKEIRAMLTATVTSGSGRNAQLSQYSSAGKTGTTEKFDTEAGRYSKSKRIAGFAGFAPSEDPYITVYINIDEPAKKPYYGGKWAAPAFADIAESTLRYLNVTPKHDIEPTRSPPPRSAGMETASAQSEKPVFR